MPTLDQTVIAGTDIYAGALSDLAEKRALSDQVLAELAELGGGIERDADLHSFLTSPAVDDGDRGRVMEKVFRGKMSDLLLDALLVMNAKGRANLIPVLPERLLKALRAREGG